MKPIFNKIFNQIDKIYSEQTGMIYPVSAAVGGNGPIPPGPTPTHKFSVKGVYMRYAGNISSFKNVWDTNISLTFNEPAPEGWQGYVTMPNVYVAEYGPEPHPYEVVDLPFDGTSRQGAYFMAGEPAWVIGDFPTTGHVKIMVNGEVWDEMDIDNIVDTTEIEPTYGNIQNVFFTENEEENYDISFEVQDFEGFTNGWSGVVEIPDYDTYMHQEIPFDDTATETGTMFDIYNQVVNPVPTNGHAVNIYLYDQQGILRYNAYSSASVRHFVKYFNIENMTGNANDVIITKNGNPSTGVDLSYSYDKLEWTLCEYDSNNTCSIPLGAHESVYFRSSTGLSQNSDAYYSIDSSNPIAVSGDLRTLIDYSNSDLNTAQSYGFYNLFAGNTNLGVNAIDFSKITILNDYCYASMFGGCTLMTVTSVLPATTLADHCYDHMFAGCISLNVIPSILPATTLAYGCYYGMFEGCENLLNTPTLPATTLASECYHGMFAGCIGLTRVSELPATTLTYNCYYEMFSGCEALVTPPTIRATTLAAGSFRGMFEGCTSLTSIPSLPVNVLTEDCYRSMFSGCTSLTAVELPATTLAENCYTEMFKYCDSLAEISTGATEWDETFANEWVKYVAAEGDFYNNGCATIPTGDNGIPTGWNEIKDCPKIVLNGVIIEGPHSGGPFSNVYDCHYDITFNETPPAECEDGYGGYLGNCVITGVCVADETGVIKDTGNYVISGISKGWEPYENYYASGDPTYPYGQTFGPATLSITDGNGNVWATATTDNVTISQ